MLIGVLGGGQLGRMLALAGVPLGLRFRFLDPSPYAPAGAVGELVVGDLEVGSALEKFSRGLDLATLEFENVPVAAAQWLAERVPLAPSPGALAAGQDRLAEKTLFRVLGIDVPEFMAVDSPEELAEAQRRIGTPLVVKTRRLGYDGKGQVVLRAGDDPVVAWSALGEVPLLAEQFVPFERELSVIACRGRDGEFAAYPLAENVHRGGILRISTAPASVTPELESRAVGAIRDIMNRLDYVGVMALEMFEHKGRLLANEIAPRVHNTGHWTIDGAATSQFENHCRAVVGLPLGSCAARERSVMVNLIGALPDPAAVLRIPGARLHLYGKEPRPGRKVGHITLLGGADERLPRVLALPGAG